MTLSFPKDIIFNGDSWVMPLKFNINIISTFGGDGKREGYRVKESESSEVATLYYTVINSSGVRMEFEVLPEDEFDRELMYVKELPSSTTATNKYNVTNVYDEAIGFEVVVEDN